MKDYKIITLTSLIQALRKAYIASCKALGLASKLKDGKAHKSRVLSRMNKLRAELNKYDNKGLSLFESVAYRGVLINQF